MVYQKFLKRRVVTRQPKIIVGEKGIFWLNSETLEKFFRDFKRVFLFWDEKERKVGFQPTNDRKGSFSISRTKNRFDATVSGTSFLRYYNIEITQRKTFVPTWNEKEKLVEIKIE